MHENHLGKLLKMQISDPFPSGPVTKNLHFSKHLKLVLIGDPSKNTEIHNDEMSTDLRDTHICMSRCFWLLLGIWTTSLPSCSNSLYVN